MVPSTLPADYEIREEVGRGAKGVVYRAFSKRLDREVAVKVLMDDDPSELLRFQQEAKLLERFYHPNVVTYIESADNYLVMEFLGGNLYELLRGRPGLQETCRIFAQIARGLAYIHSHGLVHRDLKPENVLLTREWVPKITDFGTARELGGISRLTTAGTLVGTWGYLAPEQIEKGQSEAPADLYALGVCLFEAVTGQPPFRAETQIAMAIAHIHQAPPNPREIRPDVPGDLDRLILRLLRKKPADRPESAAEVALRLDEVALQLTPPGREEVALRGRTPLVEQLAERIASGPIQLALTGARGAGTSSILQAALQRVPSGQIQRLGSRLEDLTQAFPGQSEELWSAFEAGGPQAAALLWRRSFAGIVAIDDFELLDPTLQAVVRHFLQMPGGGWVLATSPESAAELCPNAAFLRVPPLGGEDQLAIATEVLDSWPEGPSEMSAGLQNWLLEKSAGLPRRIRLYLLSLRGMRSIAYNRAEGQRGCWDWSAGPPTGTSFWDLVGREISELATGPRRLANTAVLLEEPIAYTLLMEACGLKEEEVEESLDELVRIGLFEEIWSAQGDSYRFSSLEVKSLIGRDLDADTVRELHESIARVMKKTGTTDLQARRGHHLACAGRDDEALPLLQEAAQRAQERGLWREAADAWEGALACSTASDADGRLYFLARTLECLTRDGQDDRAVATSKRMLPVLRAAAPLWRLESLHWLALGERPPTRELLEETLRSNGLPVLPSAQTPTLAGGEIGPAAAALYISMSRFSDEIANLEAAVELLTSCFDRSLTARAYRLLGVAQLREGQIDKARENLTESFLRIPALALAERLATLWEMGSAFGRQEAGQSAYREALALAEELGDLEWQARLRQALSELQWQEGDTDAAFTLLAGAVPALRTCQSPALAGFLLRLGELSYIGGLGEKARALLGETVAQAQEAAQRGAAQFALGWIAFEEEDFEEAGRSLQNALLAWKEAGDKGGASRTLSLLSALARRQKRLGESRQEAEEALQLAQTPLERGLAMAAQGTAGLKLLHKQAFAHLQAAHSDLSLPYPSGPIARCQRLASLLEVEALLEKAGPSHSDQEDGLKKTASVDLEAEAVAPDLELEVWGTGSCIPLRNPSYRIAGAEPADLVLSGLGAQQFLLHWRLGGWMVRGVAGEEVIVNGLPLPIAQLNLGDPFQLGGSTLQLGRAGEPRAFLSEVDGSQVWGLRDGDYPIGHSGGRPNRILLDHPSLEDVQATLRFRGGDAILRSERAGSNYRNGFVVGENSALLDGDLVRLGSVLLRYRTARPHVATSMVTVLALDIDPSSEVMRLLDEALERREGRLLPYSGQAFLAVFEQGNHAWKALDAARALRLRLRSRNISPRIGIDTGAAPVLAGPPHFAQVENVALRAFELSREAGIFVSRAALVQLPRSINAHRVGESEIYEIP